MDWPLILAGAAGFLPALLTLLFSYAPYDGYFKDNILFLCFMFGLAAGMGLAVFEILLRIPRGDAYYTFAMVILGFPLLEQAAKLLYMNRRTYQGDREATFYGGAFGLGVAALLVLFKAQRDIPTGQYADLGNLLGDPANAIYLLLVGIAIVLGHFATGLMIGDGVRIKRLPGPFLLSVAALVPLYVLVFQFTAGISFGRASEGLVYLPIMLVYAVALAWWAHATLLPKALPPDAQRKRRRLLLRAKRAKDEV